MATKIELYREGVKLKDAKEFAPAIEKFKEALALDEKFTMPLHAMVQCYTELGNHEEAIRVATQIVQIEPDDQFSYISLSRAYQRGGLIPEAEMAMMQGQQAQIRAQQMKR